MTGDRVVLTVPAKSEFAKVVRMTSAALASRMGMSFDDVEDVRMAVEEAFVYAVHGSVDGGDVSLVFGVASDSLEISVCVGAGTEPPGEDAERRASLATFILDSVCDRYEFTSEENGTRWLKIVKQAKAVDAD